MILVGADATKDAFLRTAKDYRIIHLASHVAVDADDPLFSYVCLAQNPEFGQSGMLHGFEILDAQISAELVVLSSCNSGRLGGERDVAGILTAFLASGVRSVVATLWSVDDQSSAYLMERFYSYIRQGASTSASLRRAKMDLIRSGRSDPYYWGAFILFGDDSIVNLPATYVAHWSSWTFALSLAMLVALCAFTLCLWRKRPFASFLPFFRCRRDVKWKR
jgi:CHAT domain-containing protein